MKVLRYRWPPVPRSRNFCWSVSKQWESVFSFVFASRSHLCLYIFINISKYEINVSENNIYQWRINTLIVSLVSSRLASSVCVFRAKCFQKKLPKQKYVAGAVENNLYPICETFQWVPLTTYNEKNNGKQCFQHFILCAPVALNVPKKRHRCELISEIKSWKFGRCCSDASCERRQAELMFNSELDFHQTPRICNSCW